MRERGLFCALTSGLRRRQQSPSNSRAPRGACTGPVPRSAPNLEAN
jgi:hypothetical protein